MADSPEDVKRLIAVGDIHGCLSQLVTLMDRVVPSAQDQFVFVGDYIDRGADSRGVVEYLIGFGQEFPGTVFLKGNHEDMLLRALGEEEVYLEHFVCNGGLQTIESYGSLEAIPAGHLDFFRELTLFYETERFFISHAGVNPAKALHAQDEHDLLWVREPFLTSGRDFGKTIVHGHTPEPGPLVVEGRRINVDTGAVYCATGPGGKDGLGRLTAMDVLTGEFWQAGD
ncbi:MAG: serine/threonine protein phosphatase [Desulfuromonadales bacterium]|nr:serine/threonine protein phosphatase [Desulfuromonadales bacterium]NIS44250.1 serine/threonine protein phosphatase [Desulfuromonadales bacterium]